MCLQLVQDKHKKYINSANICSSMVSVTCLIESMTTKLWMLWQNSWQVRF